MAICFLASRSGVTQAEYLTGLMIAQNTTITGINGEFAETTDQSCLNRFLTAVDWDTEPRKILVTNRVRWEVCRILPVY